MSTAANKAIVQGFLDDVLNRGKPARAVEQFARASYVHYGPMVIGRKKAFIEYFERVARKFPGTCLEFRHVIAEGDFVVVHCRYQWSNEDGSEGIEIFRLDACGNMVEHWGVIEPMPERVADSSAMPRERRAVQ